MCHVPRCPCIWNIIIFFRIRYISNPISHLTIWAESVQIVIIWKFVYINNDAIAFVTLSFIAWMETDWFFDFSPLSSFECSQICRHLYLLSVHDAARWRVTFWLNVKLIHLIQHDRCNYRIMWIYFYIIYYSMQSDIANKSNARMMEPARELYPFSIIIQTISLELQKCIISRSLWQQTRRKPNRMGKKIWFVDALARISLMQLFIRAYASIIFANTVIDTLKK